jgi:hypothetical protein
MNMMDPRKRAMAAALQGGPAEPSTMMGRPDGYFEDPSANVMTTNGYTGPELQGQMGMLNEDQAQGQFGMSDDDVLSDFFQAVSTGVIPKPQAAALIKQFMAVGGAQPPGGQQQPQLPPPQGAPPPRF